MGKLCSVMLVRSDPLYAYQPPCIVDGLALPAALDGEEGVQYVRFSDPDCRPNGNRYSDCETYSVSVLDLPAASRLWTYDKNKDQELRVEDLSGAYKDRYRQLVDHGWNSAFHEPSFTAEQRQAFVRAHFRIKEAYLTVKFFLKKLPSSYHNSSHPHEFTSQEWKEIVSRLGKGAEGYSEQVDTAAQLFDHLITTLPGIRSLKIPEISDGRETGHSLVLDFTQLNGATQIELEKMSRAMAEVFAFAKRGEIMCMNKGAGCRTKDKSPPPYQSADYRGLSVAIRIDDAPDGTPKFKNLAGWTMWLEEGDWPARLTEFFKGK